LTNKEFEEKIATYYKYRTGLGTNILMMTMISFLVGLSIAGQTFYSFVTENIEKFGALKAIGAKGYELVSMILFQALFTGFTGYGLGNRIMLSAGRSCQARGAGLHRQH
jgi:putative ABC transport system permease protein